MHTSSRRSTLSALLVIAGLCTIALLVVTDGITVQAIEAKSVTAPQPVDKSMHHFMEYVFEPNYKRLKAAMAEQPADKQAWKAIKGDVLTLAECANLLLLRAPDEDAGKWRELSVATRSHGGDLYQAARKADYASASRAYETMLKSCNACHDHFAEGEHQLSP